MQYFNIFTKNYGPKFNRKLRRVTRYIDIVKKYAKQYNVPVNMALAVIHAESAGRPNLNAGISSASGLMQITAPTADTLGLDWSDRFDPEENIKAGVKNLGKHLKSFKGNVSKAILAHHSGAGGARKLLAGKSKAPLRQRKEAVEYVPRVLKLMEIYK